MCLFVILQIDDVKTTAQKMEFSIKDFFSKCDQIRTFRGFGHIY